MVKKGEKENLIEETNKPPVGKKVEEKSKKTGLKKKLSKPKEKRMTAREREQLLIENFVGLQKAMTNLSIKFEHMSENIIRLLNIFELSAKHYIQGGSKETDTDLLNKIDSLLEQNKTIAKGLVLMEENVRKRAPRVGPQTAMPPTGAVRPRPLPRI